MSSPLTLVPLVLSRSVRTILSLVLLDFDMEAADPLVVELDRVAFLATDRYRCLEVAEDETAIRPAEHP